MSTARTPPRAETLSPLAVMDAEYCSASASGAATLKTARASLQPDVA